MFTPGAKREALHRQGLHSSNDTVFCISLQFILVPRFFDPQKSGHAALSDAQTAQACLVTIPAQQPNIWNQKAANKPVVRLQQRPCFPPFRISALNLSAFIRTQLKHFLQLKAAAARCGRGNRTKLLQQFHVSAYLAMAPTSPGKPNHFAKTGKAFAVWDSLLCTRGFVETLRTCHALFKLWKLLGFLKGNFGDTQAAFLSFKPHMICFAIQQLLWINK